MDYKFWIMLMMCIILFYMYHQIEDLRSEIHHLHNKTDNLSELEKYIGKSKKIEVMQNLDDALKSILPDNNEIVLDNDTTSSEFIESEQSNHKFEVNVNEVMNLVETNKVKLLNSDLNNQFKIKELSNSETQQNSSISFTSLHDNKNDTDTSDDSDNNDNNDGDDSDNNDGDDSDNNDLDNDDYDDSDNDLDNNSDDGNLETQNMNEISISQLEDIVTKSDGDIDGDIDGDGDIDEDIDDLSEINSNSSLSKLMRLKLDELQEMAIEKSIELEKDSEGMKKKRNKKELCTEILNSNYK